ncbi:MAG: hypothetical protein KF830_07970 [Planctomycetes bacterium]|nr:hypothetical protein [Planctomycetota bacterium]
MRNQTARVALAACLFTAAAAAQAPASEDNRRDAGDGTLGARLEWLRSQAPQGEDYSLRRLFQESHGEFMNRRERFKPQLELRASVWPNQRINHEPGSFEMLGYGFNLEAQTLVSTDGYLILGGYYNARRYQFSNAFGSRNNASGIPDDTLHAAGGRIGFGVFVDDNVLFEVEAAPGAWSDLDGTLHTEDFDMPSRMTFTFRTSPGVFVKIGARYNQVFKDAPVLPVLGLNWEISEHFRFDLDAPERVEFSWWPSAATGILFGAQVTGAEYHVRTSLAQQQANPPGRGDVNVQEVVAYLGLMQRFNDYTSLAVRAGLVIAGDYKFTSGATGFDIAEGALDQAFFADVSFGINF